MISHSLGRCWIFGEHMVPYHSPHVTFSDLMTMFSRFLPFIHGGVPCNHRQKVLHQPLSGLSGWKNSDRSVSMVAGMHQLAATGRLCKSCVGSACQESIPRAGGYSMSPLTQCCNFSGFCSGRTVTKCWDVNSFANKMPILTWFSFQLFFFQWCLQWQWSGYSPSDWPVLSLCVCVIFCILSYDHFKRWNFVFLLSWDLWDFGLKTGVLCPTVT